MAQLVLLAPTFRSADVTAGQSHWVFDRYCSRRDRADRLSKQFDTSGKSLG
jgi:hypothetical protein